MLAQDYREKIAPKLVREFGLATAMAAPKVEKVVVNMGIGQLKDNKEARDQAMEELGQITGQRPSVKAARKSVSGFNLRKGEPVGLSVTLRGERMYSFLEKLFNVVLPRLRDFRGVRRASFDKNGNYTLGIGEHTVFPEVDLGKVDRVKGLEITIVTNTRDKEKAARLLEELGMPFQK